MENNFLESINQCNFGMFCKDIPTLDVNFWGLYNLSNVRAAKLYDVPEYNEEMKDFFRTCDIPYVVFDNIKDSKVCGNIYVGENVIAPYETPYPFKPPFNIFEKYAELFLTPEEKIQKALELTEFWEKVQDKPLILLSNQTVECVDSMAIVLPEKETILLTTKFVSDVMRMCIGENKPYFRLFKAGKFFELQMVYPDKPSEKKDSIQIAEDEPNKSEVVVDFVLKHFIQ